MIEIRPQKGFQEKFLASQADIVIGGGAAGAGKTYALLLEFMRHRKNKRFGGAIFRRTYQQVKNEGGLWDSSSELYPLAGAEPKESNLSWKFPSGAKLKFSHLEYEKNKYDYQGAEIPFIGFDELTHFSESMFFYLMSRNRSTCGIRPYIRATCNPDPDSWVYNLIEWWIGEDGFPIPERNGVLRYFVKDGDTYVWGDSYDEVIDKADFVWDKLPENANYKDYIKSITFISGSIYQNQKLLESNPQYLANLMSQDEATKKALLDGNWFVSSDETDIFDFFAFNDIFTNEFRNRGEKYITADIALKGSDLLIAFAWDGYVIVDVEVVEKSKSDVVIERLKDLARRNEVPERNVVYDDDGVGAFVDGFIKQANGFNNNSKPLNDENFKNLKAQCIYKMADLVNQNQISILPAVSNKKIAGKTIMQHLKEERKAFKREKPDTDGKLSVIPKEKMKAIIGHSPDFMDAFYMRYYLKFRKQVVWA
ncbi:MAG: terminase family protein [Candidatus Cloacimonetes bacterium]|nr:terminase family protein [Candidatus Cloacimonadota bacterium]